MTLPSGIHIGTSGWNYADWNGHFYPANTKDAHMLATYAESFGTVEVNSTFYNLPKRQTVKTWSQQVPDDFIFVVKASRYITHMKKLKNPEQPLNRLYRIIEVFGDQLGPVLFQFPPNWQVNLQRLDQFLKTLSQDFQYTFEFRDESWHCDAVYERLQAHNAAFCFFDYQKKQTPRRHTADFAYMRMHGPHQQAYKGSYASSALDQNAQNCRNSRKSGRAVFCYFDNDQKACAPHDAMRLLKRIRGT